MLVIQVVTIYDFSSLLSKAWMESMSAVNIIQGFKTTEGIRGTCTVHTFYEAHVPYVFVGVL